MYFDNKIDVRSLLLLTFIVLTGCGGGGGGNVAPIITAAIAPEIASLTPGGSQQFSSTVGGTTNTAVTWSTTGGSITSGGLYTAPATPGTYTVTVTTQATPVASDTVNVTVTAGAPVPTVVVSPKTASLTQGGTQQFGAAVGGTTNTAVTWSATGGSITSGGFYTAPTTSGTYTVTVTTQATPAASDTASVTVAPMTLAWRGVNLAGAEFGQDTQQKLMSGTYHTDWVYPSANEVVYFKSKGMNMIRIPFRWERIQRTLNASLDAEELARLKTLVNSVTGNGMTALLDVQNFARYGYDSAYNSTTNLIGSSAVPVDAFADLWSRLATEFKGNPNVMFGLMNEPHDMDIHVWVNAANQAIAAIRTTGATNTIAVPGVQWTGAWAWNETWYTTDSTSNATEMLKITDSGNNILFEVHQYLDTDYSGQYTSGECVYDSAKLANFTAWLKANNKKGLLGEIGAPSTTKCDQSVADVLSHVQANADVWSGWLWWAAGPWWNNYPLSIEPTWSGDWETNGTPNSDKPQMSVLAPFLQ